jgi:hypothetical protein
MTEVSMTKLLDDQSMEDVVGGLVMIVDPLAPQAEPHIVDGKGATLAVFLKVLDSANPYAASNGNLIQGDGFRIPGVSILPAPPPAP